MIQKRNLPPERLPQKASADEYYLLSIQYVLLGSMHLSFKAVIKAMQGHSVYGRQFIELYCARTGSSINAFNLNRAQYTLVLASLMFIDFAWSALWPLAKFLWAIASNTSKFMAVIKAKLTSQPNPTASVSAEAENLTRALARSTVPTGLTASDYLRLGKQYKQNGWIGQAQQALELAQEVGRNSDIGREAEVYLRTKVPRAHVPLEVEVQNIKGYQAAARGDLKEAREIFEPLMLQYPDFEWSYLNLATAYTRDRQPEQAKYLLRKLLSINPEHVEAWDSLARIYASEFDLDEAKSAIERATELLPEDSANLKALIECLAVL